MKNKKVEQEALNTGDHLDEDIKINNQKSHKFAFPKFGSFVVGKMEFPDLEGLSPIKAKEDQQPLYKNQGYRKYAKAKKTNLNFISAKKLQPKKRVWKKMWFRLTAVLVMGVVTGAVLGSWYKDYTEGLMRVDYPASAEPYLDNTEEVVAKIQSGGGSPLNYSLSENFIMASYNAEHASSFYMVGRGGVNTIASQSIFSIRAFDGETYELTSQSLGMMTVAICAIYNPSKDPNHVDLVGNLPSGKVYEEDADWDFGTITPYTKDGFIDKNGSLPSIISPYVVSSQTVLNNSTKPEETTYNEKKAYVYTMELDPILGAIRYHKQVMLTSGLGDKPKFTTISIKVYMDENWNFIRTEITEKYKVKFGVMADCDGSLNIDYTFNEPVTLPYYMD